MMSITWLVLGFMIIADTAGRRLTGRESLFLTDAANNQVVEMDIDGTCRSIVTPTEGATPFPADIAFTPDLLLPEEQTERPDLLRPVDCCQDTAVMVLIAPS